MMSRLTLHLKEQAAPARHEYGAPCEVTFSRNRSFSDATIRTRSHSFTHSDYLTGGADIGVNFARSAPLRRLPTICSERSSSIVKWAPDNNGGSSVSTSGKLSEITRWDDTQLDPFEMEVTQVRASMKRDEETL
jgi:hypothetical protein